MGGNALKMFGAVSVDAATYKKVVAQLEQTFNEIGLNVKIVQAYTKKETFGDIDVLFVSDLSSDEILDAVKERVDVFGTYKNGPVFGFGYVLGERHILQVDMIRTRQEEFDFAFSYFSWNDLGNLIGRVAHKLGVKHGHDGLKMVVRDSTHVLGEILLTRDYEEAVRFLGFGRVPESFSDLPEIFEYVRSSKYFNPEIYLLDNRNHIARMRDKKRKVYRAFLEYISEDLKTPENFFPFNKDKSVYHDMIFEQWPEAKAQYDDMMEKLHIRKLAKEKLNGDVVREVTGAEGKELGAIMMKLKSHWPFNSDLEVSKLSSEEIEKNIRKVLDEV